MAVQFLRLIMPIVKILRLCETTMRASFSLHFTAELRFSVVWSYIPIPLQMLSNAVREKLPCFENLPNFLNLTRLEIEASGDYCWFTLTVQTNEPPKWPSLLHVNSSVNHKWRNPGFVHAPEHENALVLEKMAIRFGRGMIRSPEDRVVRRLTECQMGSSASRITFSP
ncbi:hypothetical protein OIU77_008912 [Salix suchowensis]|uniref:Uncharacterized protein n=1 Tax=Salix suchowensis TaxID=1278906 RepID=A0ABQ9ACK7_9ROSI|nr:hypothetical protein OIU77_008912 [Salix suchowensis]